MIARWKSNEYSKASTLRIDGECNRLLVVIQVVSPTLPCPVFLFGRLPYKLRMIACALLY